MMNFQMQTKLAVFLYLFLFLFELFFYFKFLVPQQKVEVKEESAKNKDLDDLESFLN